jgi:hypothetical protein
MDRPQVQRRRFGRTEGHPRERRVVAGRPNWTIRRLRAKIKARADQPFAVVQGAAKNFRWRRPRYTLNGRQIGSEVERISITVDDLDGLSSTASKSQNVVAGSGTRRETVHGIIYQDRRRSGELD